MPAQNVDGEHESDNSLLVLRLEDGTRTFHGNITKLYKAELKRWRILELKNLFIERDGQNDFG